MIYLTPNPRSAHAHARLWEHGSSSDAHARLRERGSTSDAHALPAATHHTEQRRSSAHTAQDASAYEPFTPKCPR